MPWIPHSERTPHYYIFDVPYQCAVSNIAAREIEDLLEFGMPTSNNAFLDYESANQPIERRMTINQIYELFKKGVVVRFLDPQVIKTIYEHIVAHLTEWDNFLVHNIAPSNIPAEDLIGLDELADSLYGLAAAHINVRESNGDITDYFQSFSGIDVRAIERRLAGLDLDKGKENKHKHDYPPRRSFAEVFKSYLPLDHQVSLGFADGSQSTWHF